MGIDASPLIDLRDFDLERRTTGDNLRILSGVDLRLKEGQWIALLGANGSGKSSLLKYLAAGDSPAGEGTAYMAQDPDEQLVAQTVAGEIALGRAGLDPGAELTRFGLKDQAALDPRLLSAGQKQRLVLATALGCAPRILLCDEPTALQDSRQAGWILEQLDNWRREPGRGLLTATCDRREAQRADWLIVLRDGAVVAQGPRETVWGDDAVQELLLDRDQEDFRPGERPRPSTGGQSVLTLQGVGCDFVGPGGGFAGLDLQVGRGGRVGLTGPNGCGKSTLLAVCAGLRPPQRGTVRVDGRRFYPDGGPDLDHGLTMLAPQFPEYMFLRPRVSEEISFGPPASPAPPAAFLGRLGLDPTLRHRNPHDLSTGERRRLAVGLVLGSARPLLLLDEPTAALDRRGRAQILDLLDEAPTDSCLVIASHDRGFLAAAGCSILEMGLAGPAEGC